MDHDFVCCRARIILSWDKQQLKTWCYGINSLYKKELGSGLDFKNTNIALESFPTSGIVILHGPSGSGKTRLMQAAARYFSAQKGLDILHCCILDLIQEMVEAIKEAAYTAFRASLMRRDALFIDNIWLLHRRPQTACEVFSLFESFAGKGGLVMIASDLPLSQLSEWSMDVHPKR